MTQFDVGPTPARESVRGRLVSALAKLRTATWRKRVPRRLRNLIYHLSPKGELDRRTAEVRYRNTIGTARRIATRERTRLGIIKDGGGNYGYYEAACLELGVPYEIVDIHGPNWINDVLRSRCDAFVIWPTHTSRVEKKIVDERLRLLSGEMGRTIFPDFESLWLYESKHRIYDWLKVHGVPHAATWVFTDRREAEAFLQTAPLPLVFKTDLGCGSSGVKILRSRAQARRLVASCFNRGYVTPRQNRTDATWGTILFQEYIPDAIEWRMIRIGDSYFGHQKLRVGDFHSGSQLAAWVAPPPELLTFCRMVTDTGSFSSMNLDVFETSDGRFLVNELQALFGCVRPYQMVVDGRAGSYQSDADTSTWHFEEGIFCHNACCNLRVAAVLKQLGYTIELPNVHSDAVADADRNASIEDGVRERARLESRASSRIPGPHLPFANGSRIATPK